MDAIRKFKESQERKKREEDERKIKEKLSTLQHRASQGDRKAKSELRKIEQVNEEKNKQPSNGNDLKSSHLHHHSSSKNGNHPRGADRTTPRPKQKEADFEELMKLAKKNNNEMRLPEEKKVEKPKPIGDKRPIKKVAEEPPRPRDFSVQKQTTTPKATLMRCASGKLAQHQPIHPKLPTPATVIHRQPVPSYSRMRQYDDEEPEDDQYEDDGFVVDEDEDEAREELQRTLKSVFRYDRRRCDLREEELDRQYRAIGKVTTFEDLEREERRASRLAAMEDARAQREEEERKRLKKIRLNRG